MLPVLQKGSEITVFCFVFFPLCHVAGCMLVPHSWMESVPPPVYVHSPNNWTTREFASKITFALRVYLLPVLLIVTSLCLLYILYVFMLLFIFMRVVSESG